MGRGPEALVQGGLLERLHAGGHPAENMVIDPEMNFRPEINTAFALNHILAEARAPGCRARRVPARPVGELLQLSWGHRPPCLTGRQRRVVRRGPAVDADGRVRDCACAAVHALLGGTPAT